MGRALRYLAQWRVFLLALSSAGSGCTSEPLAPEPERASAGSGGNAPMAGLPCEVDALLAKYCHLCHGRGTLIGLMRLVTHDDLSAPAVTDPSLTTGQLALLRMTSAELPMPPSGARVSEPELAAFRAWVEAGQPATGCAAAAPDSER